MNSMCTSSNQHNSTNVNVAPTRGTNMGSRELDVTERTFDFVGVVETENWRLLSSSALGVRHEERPQFVSYFSSSAWKRG